MTQLRGPTAFYQIASLVVANVEGVLATSLGGPVQRACVVPGDIIWDGCTCGLLAVSVRRWSLVDTFPEGFTAFGRGLIRATPCDVPYIVGELRVQVIRCAPIPDGNALEVPCVDLDAAAQVLLSDAYVTMTEIISTLCELREDDRIVDYVVGDQETLGPNGDCVGTEIMAQVALYR